MALSMSCLSPLPTIARGQTKTEAALALASSASHLVAEHFCPSLAAAGHAGSSAGSTLLVLTAAGAAAGLQATARIAQEVLNSHWEEQKCLADRDSQTAQEILDFVCKDSLAAGEMFPVPQYHKGLRRSHPSRRSWMPSTSLLLIWRNGPKTTVGDREACEES